MSLCRSLANLFACGVRPEMLDGGGGAEEEEEQVRAKVNTTLRAEKGYQNILTYSDNQMLGEISLWEHEMMKVK